jgi:uncharacterized membrane protein
MEQLIFSEYKGRKYYAAIALFLVSIPISIYLLTIGYIRTAAISAAITINLGIYLYSLVYKVRMNDYHVWFGAFVGPVDEYYTRTYFEGASLTFSKHNIKDVKIVAYSRAKAYDWRKPWRVETRYAGACPRLLHITFKQPLKNRVYETDIKEIYLSVDDPERFLKAYDEYRKWN